MRCMLVGNYGVENLGDTALRDFFLERFSQVEWVVVSENPVGGEVPRLPGGLRSLLSLRWIRTWKAIRSSDAMVFGGGSLFTDAESVYACFLWFIHAFVASIHGKPIILAFQGIGPFRTRIGQWLARWVVRRAAFISVRDEASKARVESWNLNTKVVLSFDPVYDVLFTQNNDSTQKVLIIIPRKNSTDIFMQTARKTSSQDWDAIRIVSMEPMTESEVCETLRASLMQVGQHSEIIPVHTLSELRAAFADASLAIAQRYHGALAALAMGIPFRAIAQKPGDKLDEVGSMDASMRESLRLKVLQGEAELRTVLEAYASPNVSATIGM